MGRPTDSGGYLGYAYGDVETQSFASAKVRVHWATSGVHAPILEPARADGVPESVAFVAETAELALGAFREMGYREVPSDTACPSHGGDDKLDIYLVRFTSADGTCVAECVGGTCSSFALVESTFRNHGYESPAEGVRTVVTHELFHAIQNVYKPYDDPFWSEGTAQWAMKTVHPDLQDFERNLPKFFAEPTRSLDAPPTGVTAGYLYGSAVWPLFLATSFGTSTIREIFELEAEGKSALEATDAVLQTRDSSLAEAFPMFAAWNAATGDLAGAGGYADAAKYPGIRTAELEDGVSAITSGLASFAYVGALTERTQIALDTDVERNRGVVVPLEDGKARLDRAEWLPAEIEGDVLVVVAGTTTRKTDAPFTLRLLPPSSSEMPVSASPAEEGGCHAAPGRSPSGGGLAVAVGGVGLALAFGRSRRRRGGGFEERRSSADDHVRPMASLRQGASTRGNSGA